jgi:hypothetical protein
MEVEGQGKKPPQSVLVEITPAEVALCFEFAQRCSKLRAYAGAPGWKGGLVNGMRLYGGIDVDGTHAGLVIGKVGEIAMCKLSGVAVDLALKDRGDGGKDLPLPSGSVQVKTSRRPFRTRMVRDPVEQCDWFVFATWNGLRQMVSVEGYVSRPSLLRLPIVPSPRGEWMNREISLSSLLPIRQLLKIRPIKEVL